MSNQSLLTYNIFIRALYHVRLANYFIIGALYVCILKYYYIYIFLGNLDLVYKYKRKDDQLEHRC